MSDKVTITITIDAPGLHDALLAAASSFAALISTTTATPPSRTMQADQSDLTAELPDADMPPKTAPTPPPAPQTSAEPAQIQIFAPAPDPAENAAQEAPAYTMMQLAKAGTELREKIDPVNGTAKLKQCLADFGVSALTQLPTDAYADFAAALRYHGAAI